MDTSSQRELRLVASGEPIADLMSDLAKALVGTGPALGFGDVHSTTVTSRVAVLVATSASTGPSKEIGLSAAAVLASAKASHNFLGARHGQRWSLLLPLTHIAGVNILVRSLELGTFPLDLRNHKGQFPQADFTAIVPTQLFKALNSDPNLMQHQLSAKGVLVGGAALTETLKKQAREAGINVVTTYGSSETSGGCVYDGRPLDGVTFKINNDKRIRISGPVLAEDIKGDWYQSEDLGEIVDGELIVLGRADDVIISGGENISLNAIESSLAKEFPTLQVAAFSVPDSLWGEALHLAVVGQFEPSTISEFLDRSVGSFAKPKSIHTLDALPLSSIGKVDRNALADRFTS